MMQREIEHVHNNTRDWTNVKGMFFLFYVFVETGLTTKKSHFPHT